MNPDTTNAPKADRRVVLLEGIHASAVEAFKREGYTDIVPHAKALSGQALLDAVQSAHLLGIRSRTQLSGDVLRHAKHLMAVGCYCIGTNQVDLQDAMRLGIPVFNAPFSNTRSVAELVLAELIMLMRGIPQKNALLHRGGWTKSAADAYEVRGKTLGIVGYGHIGTQIGVLAEHLGMTVVFHDIEAKLPLGNAHQMRDLQAVLAIADVVSLHVPQTPQTHNLIDTEQLARMKPGSHLINASRGTVVNIEALADALQRQHLHGAAIDVFPVEPQSNDDTFTSVLTHFDNVILTPHIGGSTLEAQVNIGKEVTAKLMRYADNGSTTSAVNFPELALPAHTGGARLLHIHHNVPGVLAQVNACLSNAAINISAQYLGTLQSIGYVVIDLDHDASTAAMDALSAIAQTIRCRALG